MPKVLCFVQDNIVGEVSNITMDRKHSLQKTTQLSSIITELYPNIDFQQEAQKAMELLEKSILVLAKVGWTIPCTLQPVEIFDLFDELKDKPNTQIDNFFDDFFLTYYIQDTYKEFYEITNNILANEKMGKWNSLLDECAKCFVKGHYLVTIPCLLSVIDGIIATQYKDPNSFRNKDRKQFLKEKTANSFEQSITKIMWISIEKYISCLFENIHFSAKRPECLNRNWILHGRDQTNWKRADSMRLFHAIHTLQSLL